MKSQLGGVSLGEIGGRAMRKTPRCREHTWLEVPEAISRGVPKRMCAVCKLKQKWNANLKFWRTVFASTQAAPWCYFRYQS